MPHCARVILEDLKRIRGRVKEYAFVFKSVRSLVYSAGQRCMKIGIALAGGLPQCVRVLARACVRVFVSGSSHTQTWYFPRGSFCCL